MIFRGMMLLSGSGHPVLAEEIAKEVGTDLSRVELSRFSNGEIYCRIGETVRGQHVFVIQPIAEPVNEHIMELLIMIDALKRASAGAVSAVIPHYGYARQDKQSAAREPITAKLVADLISKAGAERVISMDLHTGQIQGYFDFPVDHLTALPRLAEYFVEKQIPDAVVVAPDVGRVKTAKRFSEMVDADLAILHKERPAHNVAEIGRVIGDVQGRNCILIDDMIDTAGTITAGARTLREQGAKDIYVCATHPVLSGPAIQRLDEAPICEVVLTNTVPIPDAKMLDKFVVLSVAPLFSRAIINVFEDVSVSTLFQGEDHL